MSAFSYIIKHKSTRTDIVVPAGLESKRVLKYFEFLYQKGGKFQHGADDQVRVWGRPWDYLCY